jgi:ElaB/YqjD/DUF883 family membrane-anchored ribosome-binding protein
MRWNQARRAKVLQTALVFPKHNIRGDESLLLSEHRRDLAPQQQENIMTTPTNPSHGSPKTQTSNGPSTATEASDRIGDALDRGKSGLADSANTAGSDLAEDMRNLRSDVAKMQQTISKFASEVGAQTSRTASEVGSTVAGQVGAAANEVAKGGAEIAASATAQAKTFASELEDMARKNPLGTLAGTLLVGVVLGLITRGNRG